MRFLIVNRTREMGGAHGTTGLVNEYVNARLKTYGAGIDEVEVRLLYPPLRGPGRGTTHLDDEFRRLVQRAPRVTVARAKKRVDVLYVCRGVGPRRLLADGHFTLYEATRVTTAVAEALERIRPRFTPADQFDADAFLADAHDALTTCPAAIRRWLAR